MVSIVILTYNGEKTINDCLDSVLKQTYYNIELIVVDNVSTDGTIKMIKSRVYENGSRGIRIIENKKNIGFAGHNIGIENSGGEFVLCVNQDVILEPDFVSETVKIFQQDEKIGAVQGKILTKESRIKNQESRIIDTTGITAFKSRRFIDGGQGEKDKGQYDKIEEVFGVNGAVAFFRKECLEDVKLFVSRHPESSSGSDSVGHSNEYEMLNQAQYDEGDEYYDLDFFMYKEDIDLSWRIRLYGWKIMYCPTAIAYVERTSKFINDKSRTGQIINARKKQSQFIKSLSFKNHHLAIIKNDLPRLFVKHLIWILPREIGAWLYVLFFEPKTWPAIIDLFRQMPLAIEKRKIIMKNKKVGIKEMEKWFV